MLRAIRKKMLLLLYLLPILLFGCTDGSIFVPDLSEDESPEISTVAQGTILSAESVLPVDLPEEASEKYTRLEITIRTPEGEVVHTSTLENELLSEPVSPDISLSDLDEGTYLVELRLFEQQLEVAREESLFFLTNETLSIDGITLYPPTSEPEAQLIAEANVRRSSSDLDPYLRWRLDSRVLQEGVLSEEGATARIATDKDVGVFALTLELFPWEPPPALSYEFRSPISHETDIIVRSRGRSGGIDSYLVYSFNGHGRASGEAVEALSDDEAKVFDWQTDGEPLLTVQDEVFGYELGGARGFRHDRFILPTADTGELLPFRIDLFLLPLALNGEPESFLVTQNDEYSLHFGLTEAGVPYLEFLGENEAHRFVASVPVARIGEPLSIGFALYPYDDEIVLELFSGDLLFQELSMWRPEEAEESGSDVSELTAETPGDSSDDPEGSTSGEASAEEPPQTGELSSPSWSVGDSSATGSSLTGEGGLRYIVDELSVTELDFARPTGSVTRIPLRQGDFLELTPPEIPGEIIGYTLRNPPSETILLERRGPGGFERVAELKRGERLRLRLDEGEVEYAIHENDWRPLAGISLRLRVESVTQEIFIVERETLR